MSGGQLSGIPTDIAFDDLVNLGGLPNSQSVFGAGSPIPANGKDLIKRDGSNFRTVSTPQFLFAAAPGQGLIDVVRLGGILPSAFDVDPYRAGVESIIALGVSSLSSYWRQ